MDVEVAIEPLVVADDGMTVWHWDDSPAHLRAHLECTARYLAYVPEDLVQDPGLRALCEGMEGWEEAGDGAYVVAFEGGPSGTLIDMSPTGRH